MSKQELVSQSELPAQPGPGAGRRTGPALATALIAPVIAPVIAAVIAAAVLLALIPPEKTLGWIIRPVFLHGALVQVGLAAFAAAALLGVAWLIRRSTALAAWCLAVQETAAGLWVAYALSSMVTTRLAWGEWIAWDEPRVRASLHVLWFCLACLLLVRWMRHPLFTAVANIVAGAAVWYLIKGAGLLRHPFDPIGGSNSFTYQVIYWLLVLTVLAAAAAVAFARSRRHAAALAGEHGGEHGGGPAMHLTN